MATCNNCTSTAPLTTYDVQYFYNNQCFDCGDDACTGRINNAKCIVYTGPNLSCSGVNTNDSLETALQKIDEQICSVIGDYSNYQFNCLTAWWGSAITTEEEFVDAITGYACEIAANLLLFTDTTFVNYQAAVNSRFVTLEIPGTICAAASLTGVETMQDVLDAYCTQITSILASIDVSSYSTVWDQCLTVVTPPTTLEEAFTLLVDQICQINGGFVLPTINNIGSCLAAPGATDSIVDTIGKIKTYMCALDTFDAASITFGCVPSQSDLQDTIQELVTQASDRLEEVVTYSGDFVVAPTDVMDPCAGVTVSLVTPINQDRFVAVSVADVTPGTLIDKVASSAGSIDVTNDADTTLNIEVSDGNKGDITVSASGVTWTIDNDAVTFAKMQNITTARLLGRTTAGSGDVEEISVGSGLTLAAGTLSVSAPAVPISSLIAAAASNTIDNANYPQTWQWNTLNGANGLKLSSASTAGTVQYLLSVDLTGAMVSSGTSTTCAYFSNVHTGTNSTNNGIVAGASGGTTNYGVVCWGAGGQWGTSPGASIYAQGRMRIDGQIDTYGSTSGIVSIKTANNAGTWTLTLPTDDGSANQVLTTDGSGVTSWSSPITENTYTPTLTNTTNIAASTAAVTHYYRVGDVVHVWGVVDIDATAATTLSEMGMSLPIASNLASVSDLSGTGSFEDNTIAQIKGDSANDRATWKFTPQTDTNNKYSFYFTYKVI